MHFLTDTPTLMLRYELAIGSTVRPEVPSVSKKINKRFVKIRDQTESTLTELVRQQSCSALLSVSVYASIP